METIEKGEQDMLKIEVKGIKDDKGRDVNEVSIEAVGGLGDVIGEFCSVIGSFKKRLADIEEQQGVPAEFLFKASLMAELMDVDKDYAMKTIKNVLKESLEESLKESKDDKDAPVDK